jgi:hypothetical protein
MRDGDSKKSSGKSRGDSGFNSKRGSSILGFGTGSYSGLPGNFHIPVSFFSFNAFV